MTGGASRITCAGCGWTAPDAAVAPYPFHCPNADGDDVDHVLARVLDPARVAFVRGDDPNPFLRHRELLHSYQVARAHGGSDEVFSDLVRRLDRAIAAVDGHGFLVTPFGRQTGLSERLGFTAAGGVWVKDETGNVSGSHKARHLMGIMLYLQVIERLGLVSGQPPLAIASCGNAALAAAVVARAAGRVLRVYVPPHADASVLGRLRALNAEITTCPRAPGVAGDPCYHRFRAALAQGALPFCCQGTDNGLTIEGGETLGYEMVHTQGDAVLDHIVIQVGGGALASACIQAFTLATRLGLLQHLPRVHTVQTEGAFPLKRAHDRVAARMRGRKESPEQALRYAAAHRSEFMWPWEHEPRSIAHGILDDETYDWLTVVRGMLETGGSAVVVSEDTLREANAMARWATGIAVDHTGSAGLAGLLQLRREGTVAPSERAAVIFSGVDRRQTA